MTGITLNVVQISRLWKVIKQTRPDLFDDITRCLIDCKDFHVECDFQGYYFLTFVYTDYYRQQFISLGVDNANYIMIGSEN